MNLTPERKKSIAKMIYITWIAAAGLLIFTTFILISKYGDEGWEIWEYLPSSTFCMSSIALHYLLADWSGQETPKPGILYLFWGLTLFMLLIEALGFWRRIDLKDIAGFCDKLFLCSLYTLAWIKVKRQKNQCKDKSVPQASPHPTGPSAS